MILCFLGPTIPEFRLQGSLVKFDKDLVIVAGSIPNSDGSSKIYKLECVNGLYQVQLMAVTLRWPRTYVVASMIPTSYGNLN